MDNHMKQANPLGRRQPPKTLMTEPTMPKFDDGKSFGGTSYLAVSTRFRHFNLGDSQENVSRPSDLLLQSGTPSLRTISRAGRKIPMPNSPVKITKATLSKEQISSERGMGMTQSQIQTHSSGQLDRGPSLTLSQVMPNRREDSNTVKNGYFLPNSVHGNHHRPASLSKTQSLNLRPNPVTPVAPQSTKNKPADTSAGNSWSTSDFRSFARKPIARASLMKEMDEDIEIIPIYSGPTSRGRELPLSEQLRHVHIPNHVPARCSTRKSGVVYGFAANTNQGLIRNYNEDRVAIILNIIKPANRAHEQWPKCCFFGIYDGHGGVSCADFLRDNLHQYVIKDPTFPSNPKEALRRGFEAAEARFLELASASGDKSGSCAVVLLIVGDMCYLANVGDSRAVLGGDGGSKVYSLSRDHKPTDEQESKRIHEAGGKIYQTQIPNDLFDGLEPLVGPYRVLPGRLSVDRTFSLVLILVLRRFHGRLVIWRLK
jgi:hypothetical protein